MLHDSGITMSVFGAVEEDPLTESENAYAIG